MARYARIAPSLRSGAAWRSDGARLFYGSYADDFKIHIEKDNARYSISDIGGTLHISDIKYLAKAVSIIYHIK